MELYTTVDNERILRIEGDAECAITVCKYHDFGQILSVVVPDDERGKGYGKALISAVGTELKKAGIKRLDVDFPKVREEVVGFFEKTGFENSPGTAVLSVPLAELFASPVVQKAIRASAAGAVFASLSELSFDEFDDLLAKLQESNLYFSNPDASRLEQDLSGVIYDKDNELRSCVFCSENGDDLHIDFLYGFGKDANIYVLMAIGSVFRNLKASQRKNDYDNLTAINAIPSTAALFKKALGDDKQVLEAETILHMQKVLKSSAGPSLISQRNEEEKDKKWHREVRRTPYQPNVSYKMPWSRTLKTAGKGVDEMPAVVIDFDKDEDETEGLIMNGTRRITAGNKSHYSDYLPSDLVHDMDRPFYRGLVAEKEEHGEPQAIIVWEYKKYEDEEDTEAKILYFHANDDVAAKVILHEYSHEASEEYISRSYFELSGLSDEEKKVFAESGFVTSERESEDLCVSVKDISTVSSLVKKPMPNTVSLKKVGEKLYKRGVTKTVFYNLKGQVEDIAFLPMKWFDQDISAGFVSDNEIKGMLLVHRMPSGKYFIDMLAAMGSDPSIVLLSLMRYSCAAIKSKDPDAQVIIRRNSDKNRKLADKLFPGMKSDMVYFGERRDDEI